MGQQKQGTCKTDTRVTYLVSSLPKPLFLGLAVEIDAITTYYKMWRFTSHPMMRLHSIPCGDDGEIGLQNTRIYMYIRTYTLCTGHICTYIRIYRFVLH